MTIAPAKQSPRTISMAKDPAYWQALGQFIESFAGTEIILFNYLAVLSKTKLEVAKIFYGGDQAERLIEKVTQVMPLQPVDKELREKTNTALSQLKKINYVRNYLVHYVSMDTSDKGRLISNITKAKKSASVVEYRASIAVLGEMTEDLERIKQLILYCLVVLNGHAPVKRDDLAASFPALNAAWRYTPP
jgi:hypothetical protein